MGKLIIDLLSDTHLKHDKCQCDGGDIIVHAGDLSSRGQMWEAIDFLDWYAAQKYTHKILVPGNHDFCFDEEEGGNPEDMKLECDKRGIILLNDSGVTIEGIKIWGSPVQPWFHNWAFNRQRGADIKKHWDLIPQDTELLITHSPPYKVLDEVAYKGANEELNVGCRDLADKIAKTQIKLHVFGHIHEARGVRYAGPVTYVNASFLNRSYIPQAKRPIRAYREVVQDGSVVYLAEE